jgi:hypothetical protein
MRHHSLRRGQPAASWKYIWQTTNGQRIWSGQRLVARGRRIGARIAQGAASEDADAIMREYGAPAIAENDIRLA